MAAVEQPSSSVNGDIRFTIGNEEGPDYPSEGTDLEEEVIKFTMMCK